jgi:hypothetical protein
LTPLESMRRGYASVASAGINSRLHITYLTMPDAELDKAGNRLFTDRPNNLRGTAWAREFSS